MAKKTKIKNNKTKVTATQSAVIKKMDVAYAEFLTQIANLKKRAGVVLRRELVKIEKKKIDDVLRRIKNIK